MSASFTDYTLCAVLCCAGAVGLASALRGTVRQALDAYQTRVALRRHSRHSSTGSGTLGSLRSALGAGQPQAASSAWQQRRCSRTLAPLSPLAHQASQQGLPPGPSRAQVFGSQVAAAAAVGVNPGQQQGIHRLASMTSPGPVSGLSGQAAAAAAQEAVAGGSAAVGSSKGSRGRLVLHTNRVDNASSAAAGPAELAGETLVQDPAHAAAQLGPGSGSAGAADSNAAAAGSRGVSAGPRGSSDFVTRVSSASSWSDFEPVGEETAVAGRIGPQ